MFNLAKVVQIIFLFFIKTNVEFSLLRLTQKIGKRLVIKHPNVFQALLFYENVIFLYKFSRMFDGYKISCKVKCLP